MTKTTPNFREIFTKPEKTDLLETLKAIAQLRGYRFEETEHEIRMYRPDGSLAIQAKKPS